jgi:uncharacterized protein YbjT (DUF2867 family)
MIVAVLGASGRTGQQVVRHAISAGHHVRVLTRDATRVPRTEGPVEVVIGDPTTRDAVAAVLDGAEGAISALGPRVGGSTIRLCATASGHVVDLTSDRHGFRYVVVSAAGVRGFADDTAVLFRIPSMIIRSLLRATYVDKDAEAAILARSTLEWVLLRPPGLTDSPAKGTVQSNATRAAGGRISRDDLARFAVQMLTDPTYVRQAPFVSN